jgi:hypothetical protein
MYGENGFPAAKRREAIAGFTEAQALTTAQTQQLDALLNDYGQTVLPYSEETINAKLVRGNVASSGKIGTESPPRVYYQIASGRVEVSDQTAVFFPANNGGPLRVQIDPAAATQPSQLAVLVQARIEALSGSKLNPAQQQALVGAINNPGQSIIQGRTSSGVQEVTHAQSGPDGTVFFYTNVAMVTLPPKGGITINNFGAVRGGGGGVGSFAPKISIAAVSLAFLEDGFAILTAVLLLVAGILMIRQTAWARKLHFVYILLKIPSLAVGFYAWTRLAQEFGGGFGGFGNGMYIFFAFIFGMALVYPLALLIALNLPIMRRYFSQEIQV